MLAEGLLGSLLLAFESLPLARFELLSPLALALGPNAALKLWAPNALAAFASSIRRGTISSSVRLRCAIS